MRVCEVLGIDNFVSTVRLSKTDDGSKALPRWTPEYIQEQLEVYKGQLAKIWVCGPPGLNETFDKTLGKLMLELNLSRDQVDIM